MQHTIRIDDGKVYLTFEEPLDSEPTLRRFWWLVSARPEQVKDHGAAHVYDGWIEAERSAAGRAGTLSAFIALRFDNKRQADRIEEESIPCPPVRRGTETRYQWGRWERYSNGWRSDFPPLHTARAL